MNFETPHENQYKGFGPIRKENPFPSTATRLKCPECKAAIGSDDININKAIAKCSACDAVFSFEEDILTAPVFRRPEVYLPKGIEILTLKNELNIDISWRKNNATTSFLLFFALVWNAIVLPFAAFAIMSGNFGTLLFLSVHLTVGIGLIYYLLATYLNTTFITVDDRHIKMEYRPLKMPFNPEIDVPVEEVRQLFVEKYTSSTSNGKPNYAFAVTMDLGRAKKIRLVKGIDNPEQALYIEQEVERFLNIKDQPVEGEWEG